VPIPYYDTAKLDRIPNDGTWVVAYCACPHHASGEVVDALRRRGFPKAVVLDEGILFWRQKGYPLDGAAVSPAAPEGARAPRKTAP
jgi:cytochrome c oxidase cbb3-type subunit 3